MGRAVQSSVGFSEPIRRRVEVEPSAVPLFRFLLIPDIGSGSCLGITLVHETWLLLAVRIARRLLRNACFLKDGSGTHNTGELFQRARSQTNPRPSPHRKAPLKHGSGTHSFPRGLVRYWTAPTHVVGHPTYAGYCETDCKCARMPACTVRDLEKPDSIPSAGQRCPFRSGAPDHAIGVGRPIMQ